MRRELVPRGRFGLPLRRFEREMEDLMERFFGREPSWWAEEERFAPRVDLAETDESFEVTVDLPGMKPEDFKVDLKDGQLWLTGEKKEEKEEKGKTYHRVERHYGSFERLIPLPSVVDKEKVEAQYKEGVLRVTLPKTKAAQPKHIEVKA